MGVNQSIPRVKIPASTLQNNMSSKIRPLVKQTQHQEVKSRNALFNDMFQQQHTLAKRSQLEKIHFKR